LRYENPLSPVPRTLGKNIKQIIAHGGSSDNTVEIIKSYFQKD